MSDETEAWQARPKPTQHPPLPNPMQTTYNGPPYVRAHSVTKTHTQCSFITPPAAGVVRLQDSACLSSNCTGPYVRIFNCSLGHAIAPAHTSESSIARDATAQRLGFSLLRLEHLGLRTDLAPQSHSGAHHASEGRAGSAGLLALLEAVLLMRMLLRPPVFAVHVLEN